MDEYYIIDTLIVFFWGNPSAIFTLLSCRIKNGCFDVIDLSFTVPNFILTFVVYFYVVESNPGHQDHSDNDQEALNEPKFHNAWDRY